MTHIDRRVLGSITWLALAACGAPESDAPANAAQSEAPAEINQAAADVDGNEASVAPHQGAAQVGPRPAPPGRTANEQSDKSRSAPSRSSPPPVIQRPASPPREVRTPEIHPPHPEPSDEVPR